MNQPLVTIIAVCYNQYNYLQDSLNSILLQNYNSIQLIIADDGSTDGSKIIIEQWIKEFSPDTIFINNKVNLGLTKNINTALPYVKGDYFQVFGCDDIMMPHKIEKQVLLLSKNTEDAIIYSDMELINTKGNSLGQRYYEKHIYKNPTSGWLYKELIDRFIISAPSVLIKIEVLKDLKKYNEELDYEDHDFFLRASKKYKFIYMPESTVAYRISENSLTGTNTSLKFLKNSFLIFYFNYDANEAYVNAFQKKLIFYMKNLYKLKFSESSTYFFKAFIKTRKNIFLKYGIASVPFYFKKPKEV